MRLEGCRRETSQNWKREKTAVPSANIRPVPRLGLLANWQQFSLLVLVNGFVGTMVGTERVLLPILAGHDFGLKSRVAILSFLISFGLVKAAANSFAGRWSDGGAVDQGRQAGGEHDAAQLPSVPIERGTALAEYARLQPRKPVAEAGAAEEDQQLVAH